MKTMIERERERLRDQVYFYVSAARDKHTCIIDWQVNQPISGSPRLLHVPVTATCPIRSSAETRRSARARAVSQSVSAATRCGTGARAEGERRNGRFCRWERVYWRFLCARRCGEGVRRRRMLMLTHTHTHTHVPQCRRTRLSHKHRCLALMCVII